MSNYHHHHHHHNHHHHNHHHYHHSNLRDGQPGVEAVTLELLLGLVAVATDDHHVLEHPEGDRLDMNDIHYRGPALFGISRRDLG